MTPGQVVFRSRINAGEHHREIRENAVSGRAAQIPKKDFKDFLDGK